MKAEILINVPFGQAFAEVEVCADGSISLQAAEVAMSYALNQYNQLADKVQGVAIVQEMTLEEARKIWPKSEVKPCTEA